MQPGIVYYINKKTLSTDLRKVTIKLVNLKSVYNN